MESHFEALLTLLVLVRRFVWVRSDSTARSRAFQAKVNGVHLRSLLLGHRLVTSICVIWICRKRIPCLNRVAFYKVVEPTNLVVACSNGAPAYV